MRKDRLDDRPYLVAVLVEALEPGLGFRARRGRDEVAPELAHEEGGVARVLEAEAARVLPAEVAAPPEDRLRAVVVQPRLEAKIVEAGLGLVVERFERLHSVYRLVEVGGGFYGGRGVRWSRAS